MTFERLATISLDSPGRVSLGVVGVVVLVAALALPPPMEGDLMRLIPDDHPSVMTLAAHRNAPGGQDPLVVTLPPDADHDEIAARLARLPSVQSTFHGFTGPIGLKLALLQFTPAQLAGFADEILGAVAAGDPESIEVPAIGSWPFLWPLEPLAVFDGPDAARAGESRALFVIPMESAADPEFAIRLLDDVERLVPEAIFIAGPHADVATAIREVSDDLLRTSIVSLVLVFTIVAIALRSLFGPLVIVVPLILANVLAVSLVSLLFGSMNIYTAMGGAVVFGLGIDFGLHLVARFREQLRLGLTRPAAVRAAWRLTGPPCLTAAATSAAGFLVFVFAEFAAMRQLGVMLASGVILSLAMMLLLLPLLLTRVALPAAGRTVSSRQSEPRWRRGPWVLAVLVAVSAALVPAMPGLQFEYDISAIKSEGLAWDELTPQEQAYRETAFPPVFIPADDTAALHRHLAERVAAGDFPHIRGVVSLSSILPPDQLQRLDAMARVIEAADHPALDALATPMREAFRQISDLNTGSLGVDDLPAGLAHLIGARQGDVLLLPRGNMLDLREAQALTEELAEYGDRAASGFFVEAALGDVIATDLPRVAVLALAMVLLIIVIDLRRPALIALAAGGLGLGIVWAALVLAVSGVRINIVNIVVIPMLLGIAVDAIVHLLHRLRSGSSLDETLRTTGFTVFFSMLTTIAAFISLTAAAHRGLQSIGLVVLLGLTAMFVAAVVVIVTAWPGLADRARR